MNREIHLILYDLSQELLQDKNKAQSFVQALTNTIQEAMDQKHEHLATKTDLADLKIDLMSVINSQKNELKEDMSILRSDLKKSIYMVGLVQFLAIVGSLIGIFTFIFK
ncbi:MAG: alpha/beta hydrolase [Flavobacteriia bacterium]|nr:alpha/beta hydrolase [Flavobacteriia bacterium]